MFGEEREQDSKRVYVRPCVCVWGFVLCPDPPVHLRRTSGHSNSQWRSLLPTSTVALQKSPLKFTIPVINLERFLNVRESIPLPSCPDPS